jgi:hypothetical protein
MAKLTRCLIAEVDLRGEAIIDVSAIADLCRHAMTALTGHSIGIVPDPQVLGVEPHADGVKGGLSVQVGCRSPFCGLRAVARVTCPFGIFSTQGIPPIAVESEI